MASESLCPPAEERKIDFLGSLPGAAAGAPPGGPSWPMAIVFRADGALGFGQPDGWLGLRGGEKGRRVRGRGWSFFAGSLVY